MDVKPIEPLILTEPEIAEVAPSLAEIVNLVESAFRMDGQGDAEVPAKIGVHPSHANSFLHAMPAWVRAGPALGTKIVTYYPGNFDRGLSDSTALIVMYDPETGQTASIMEGMWITFARTAACVAVAARHLAAGDVTSLGLVGCGGLGKWTLWTMNEAFPSLREVRVASRRAETRERFCESMAGLGAWDIRPVATNEEAVSGMDVVVSSTPQQPEPRLEGAWWTPGSVAVPLDYPYAWDDAAYAAADRLVTDSMETLERYEAHAAETGLRPGMKMPAQRASIQDVVLGTTTGRRSPEDRILGVVTGIASTDVIVAWEVYRRAVEAGVGTRMRLTT